MWLDTVYNVHNRYSRSNRMLGIALIVGTLSVTEGYQLSIKNRHKGNMSMEMGNVHNA